MNATMSPWRGAVAVRCRVVSRGPNWLFVRAELPATAERGVGADLATQLLDISEQHFVYRIVLEMDDVESVAPDALGRLDELRERLAEHGGALRLCGMRDEIARTIGESIHGGLWNHLTRHGAVVGDPDEEPSWGHFDRLSEHQLK